MLAQRNSASPPRHREEPASKVEPVGVVLQKHAKFTGADPPVTGCHWHPSQR